MRLIDAEHFKEQIAAATLKFDVEPNKGLALIELVDTQPTVNEWIKVEYHYITDEERERENISEDIAYILDCRLPEDEEEILIVRKWNGQYHTEWDICLIDDGYSLDSGTEWTEVVAWMPIPKYND